jgi:metal-responsive CopG/Arc/MetJ family transcriptional regulator
MRKTAVKVAMTIPNDLYKVVEQVRKKTRKSRSAIVQDALRSWLNQQEQSVLIHEYEAGYRKAPESDQEIKAAEASAVRAFADSEWK